MSVYRTIGPLVGFVMHRLKCDSDVSYINFELHYFHYSWHLIFYGTVFIYGLYVLYDVSI